MRRIYLDTNASCPPMPSCLAKACALFESTGNASSFHADGRKMRAFIDEARLHVAKALGAKEKEVIFTSGASEGNRLIIDMLALQGEQTKKPFLCYASPFEHPSVLKPLISYAERGRIILRLLEIDSKGRWMRPQVLKEADALFCLQAHNETGFLPDLAGLMPFLPDKAILISDASQGVGRIAPVPVRVDAVIASAHKMGGLPGAGALVLRGRAKNLPSPWLGGGQERGVRPGTEAVALLSAFGEAAAQVEHLLARYEEVALLRNRLEAGLLEKWPTAFAVLKDQMRLPNTSALCFQNAQGDALRIAIDQASISVGFGAACSGLAPEPSFALTKLGLSEQEAKATVRFSLFYKTTAEEVDIALDRFSQMDPVIFGK